MRRLSIFMGLLSAASLLLMFVFIFKHPCLTDGSNDRAIFACMFAGCLSALFMIKLDRYHKQDKRELYHQQHLYRLRETMPKELKPKQSQLN